MRRHEYSLTYRLRSFCASTGAVCGLRWPRLSDFLFNYMHPCLHWVPVMYSFGVAVARATLVVLVCDSDVTHACAKKYVCRVVVIVIRSVQHQ